jgi:hypothetical protein
MLRLFAFITMVGFGAMVIAQDKKWEPPAVPEGWNSIESQTGSYRFAMPKATTRTGNRTRSISTKSFRGSMQINYAMLKDGTTLEMASVSLAGAELKGKTTEQVLDMILDYEKQEGFKVSSPKAVKLGDIPAREYRMNNDKVARRVVMFGIKPTIYSLEVSATDPSLLDTEVADDFVKSFVLVPPEVIKANKKDKADKQDAMDKENNDKFGAKWTMDFKEMTPPDAKVTGLVMGKEFKPDTIKMENGWLIFRKGSGFFAEAEVKMWLLSGFSESVENRTFKIDVGSKSVETPHIHVSVMPKGARIPTTEIHLNKYAMKLTFGEKDKDGNIPGTIYLCTPDTGHSFIAGKFVVKE